MVWSCNAVQPILETFPALDEEAPLVIFIEAPESLCRYAARQLTAHPFRAGVDLETMLRAQELVRRVLRNRDPNTYLSLRLPEIRIEAGGLHDVDDYFDAYVELAFEAAAWLQREHAGPSLGDAPGMLADLWRELHTDDSQQGGPSSTEATLRSVPEVIDQHS
jgi:hypothetical protein